MIKRIKSLEKVLSQTETAICQTDQNITNGNLLARSVSSIYKSSE